MFDGVLETIAKAILPSLFCPIMRDAAGPGCKNLKMAILLNEDLLDAYKNAEDDGGGWSYERVRSIATRYPKLKEMITTELVMDWLKQQDDTLPLVHMIEHTVGGRYWLEQQVASFRRDFFE